MTQFVGYIAMSIDARIADADGGVGWLERYAPGGADTDTDTDTDMGTDMGYGDFYAGIDALVMGRATYDFVESQPQWPYPGKRTYAVTSRPIGTTRDDVDVVEPDFAKLRQLLIDAGHRRVWILGGGLTQRAALDAGMFDEMRVFILPVVLGGGPLVFADGGEVGAKLADHRVWPGGVMELVYRFGG